MVEVGAPAFARARGRARTPLAWSVLPVVAILAGCGATATDPDNAVAADEAVTAQLPPIETTAPRPVEDLNEAEPPANIAENAMAGNATAASAPAPPAAEPPRTASGSRYTSLDPASCKPVEAGPEAAAAPRRRCPGSLDYALEPGNQNLAIIAPDGRRSQLALSKLVAKARLGKTAEWRGTGSAGPRALIVRVDGTAIGGSGAARSDLIVTRLGAPTCIVAVIPRGPGQNEKARAVADGDRLECMDD